MHSLQSGGVKGRLTLAAVGGQEPLQRISEEDGLVPGLVHPEPPH